MWIKSLYLSNFRNYKTLLVHFKRGVNVICGKNGHGKTNLLEALSILSTGRSFRTDKLQECIHYEATSFHMEALFEKFGIEQRVKIFFDGKKKQIAINEAISSQFSSLIGLIPYVVSHSSDIDLIMGSPDGRRRFLNLQLSQLDSSYLYHLSRYNKALKQRNALLKTASLTNIHVWEHQMSIAASYLIAARDNSLKRLSLLANSYMPGLSGNNEHVVLSYSPSVKTHVIHEIEALFSKHRERDLVYGSSQIGPHRDDFQLHLNGKNASSYASEGQKRSLLLALLFAKKEQIMEKEQITPLLSIDDYGSFLDPQREKNLKNHLHKEGQIFLTTPDNHEEAIWIENGQLASKEIFNLV